MTVQGRNGERAVVVTTATTTVVRNQVIIATNDVIADTETRVRRSRENIGEKRIGIGGGEGSGTETCSGEIVVKTRTKKDTQRVRRVAEAMILHGPLNHKRRKQRVRIRLINTS